MYIPEVFAEKNQTEIVDIITHFPLATVICYNGTRLSADHIPLILHKNNCLIGHIALANDLHRVIKDNSDVMAVFQSENTYISPNYYPTKQVTHKHVPTWNYQAVHVYGKINFGYSRKEKAIAVSKMTTHYERALFADKAWKMADAPKDYMENMLENIVSISIDIDKVIAKSKLSQNRTSEDFESVLNVMDKEGYSTLSKRMKRFSAEE